MIDQWEIINYFDVIGNSKEGWEVNNMCSEGNDFFIASDAKPKDYIQALRTFGLLSSKANLKTVAVENYGEMVEIYAKKGMRPIFSLRLIRTLN